ncbi:EAL domain-containing protein [Sporosarcina sp. FA9]|uniref:EAL domain-containing protein n=1 Tax=Sporosarcina sp. FA9 TaxID=3413030 RepID=UPI003F65905D
MRSYQSAIGYSTKSVARIRFPVDILKIDQSFVQDLADNPKDQAIVKSIISLAHN